MSQVIFADINPNTKTGTQLATDLNDFKHALMSGISGTSRPAATEAGGAWLDVTNDPTTWTYKIYDGVNDISVFVLDIVSGVASFSSAGALLTLTKTSADNVAPILKFLKERIAGGGQTLIGDRLGEFDFYGTDGSSVETIQARIRVISSNNTSITQQGSYVTFEATDFNTAAMVEVMKLVDSKVGIGGVGSPDNTLHVKGTGIRSETISEDAVGSKVFFKKKRVNTNGQVVSADVVGQAIFESTDQTGTAAEVAMIEVQAAQTTTNVANGSRLKIKTKKLGQTTYTDQITVEESTVTVHQDLTVTGVLVANTAHLGTVTEIIDPNIVVNKTGTQATADSNTAGITVEMSDATHFKMGYDSTKISKMVAGPVGALKEILNVDGAQQAANKSIQTPSRLDAKKDTAANLTTYASTATNGEICFGTDDKQYYGVVDSALTALGGGGGGGSFIWEMNGANAALRDTIDGMTFMSFDGNFSQDLYAFVRVPTTYSAGKQIILSGLSFAIALGAGNILFRCDTTLLRPGTSVLGTYTNIRTSTNAVKALAVSNRFENVGDVDLTSSIGQINAVAVAPGDLLRIRLYRDTANETGGPYATEVKLTVYSSTVKFS